jgi:hypothetical protein
LISLPFRKTESGFRFRCEQSRRESAFAAAVRVDGLSEGESRASRFGRSGFFVAGRVISATALQT